jgi:hypothetical protein
VVELAIVLLRKYLKVNECCRLMRGSLKLIYPRGFEINKWAFGNRSLIVDRFNVAHLPANNTHWQFRISALVKYAK